VVAGVAALVAGGGVGLALYLAAWPGPTIPPGGPQGKPPTNGAVKGPPLRLLVPAYFYPAGKGLEHWDRLIGSPTAAVTVAVVNIAAEGGPGKEADPHYAGVLERARRRGVTVIGYVGTGYGGRPLGEVKGDVDRWIDLYPGIQGIFFDQQASTPDHVDYYVTLYRHVKRRGLSLVVTNPGTVCAEAYVARPASDVVCLVEVTKGLGAYRPPAWAETYPPDRFAALLYATASPAQMKKCVLQAPDKRIGYCYITDHTPPNPWGRLPRYWQQEVQAVQEVNKP
jgi:hypothetical protein